MTEPPARSAEADLKSPPPGAGELERRRAAIARLGREVRTLVDATVRTTASPETLHGVADSVRKIAGLLAGPQRAPAEIPVVDEFPAGMRMYNPVVGAGNPAAPPMVVTATDDGLVGRCTLGMTHEGPPGYGHGGMSTMLLDDLMGRASVAAGKPGMTVSLQTRYRGPVPLDEPLLVRARVTRADGRKVFVSGSIATESNPATDLVTAEAVFVVPDSERARFLFPELSAGG